MLTGYLEASRLHLRTGTHMRISLLVSMYMYDIYA